MAALPTIAFDVAYQVGWEGLAQCLCEANRFGLAPLILPIICLTEQADKTAGKWAECPFEARNAWMR